MMFLVECPGCSAPYQVDERRVPQTGLKMRCPKCTASFQVDKPDGVEHPPQPQIAPKSNDVHETVIGVASPPRPATTASVSRAMMGVAAPGRPEHAAAPGKNPNLKGTMIGVAPGHSSPGGSPGPGGVAKRAKPPPPRPKAGTAAAQARPPTRMPSAANEKSVPESIEPDALESDAPARSDLEIDLPALGGSAARTPPASSGKSPKSQLDDLPATRATALGGMQGSRPQIPHAEVQSSGLDLDAGLDAAFAASFNSDLPATLDAPRQTPAAEPDADLPVAFRGRQSSHDSDLPAALGSFDHSDLPASSPEPRSADSDLPAALGAFTLPSSIPKPGNVRSESFSFADDPLALDPTFSPTGFHSAEAGAEPPMISGASPFRDPAAEMADEDSLQLPSPAADFDSDFADSLEMRDSFGHLDLPLVSAKAPAPSSRSAEAASSHQSTTSSALPDPAAPQDRFRAQTKIEEVAFDNEFGLRDLPPPSAPSAAAPVASPPSSGGFGSLPEFDEIEDLDTGATPSGVGDRSSAAGQFDDEDDLFGGGLSTPLSHRGQQPTVVESAGGGAGYGEVSFGGAGASAVDDDLDGFQGNVGLDTDDGMEFGGIPQQDHESGQDSALPSSSPTSSVHAQPATRLRSVAPPSSAESNEPSKKNIGRILLAAALLCAVSGGALALVPSLGPFGIHAILDLVNKDKNAALLAQITEATQQERSFDIYPRSKAAVSRANSSRTQAERFMPLTAYASYASYALVLRHGPEPEVRANAKVLLDLLSESGADEVQGYALAHAVQSAVIGELEQARDELTRLQARGSNLDVLTARGELELLAGDYATAKEIWTEAVAANPSAWTVFGLSRALFHLEDPGAFASAQEVLKLNPAHVGAKLLSAELLWRQNKEAEATKQVDVVLEQAAEASPRELITAHSLLGEMHLRRGRISKAEGEFNLALELDPKSFRPLLGLAHSYYKAGRFSAALARYEAAASTPGSTTEARVGVAKTLLALEKPEDARKIISELSRAEPKNPRVAYWLGQVAEASDNRELAQQAYELAIAEGGKSVDAISAHVALARLFGKAGDLKAASERLSEAQKQLPGSALLHKALGDIALSQGNYEQALAEFRKAEELDPADAEATFNVGSSLRRLNRFEEAWKVFEEVAKMDAELPGLPLERGLLLEQSGRSAEALKEYEAALSRNPDDYDLMLRVGCGRVVAGQGEQAEAMLEAVLKKRPKSAEANHCLGRALFLQNKNIEALRALQQAVDRDANRAEYHLYVGWVANAAGQVALAQQALATALSMDKGLADAYWQRGILMLRQGAALAAIADFKTALALRPSRVEIHADLAQAYYQIGRETESLAEWQEAIKHNNSEPAWLFRYGKLLNARSRNAEAATHLVRAIELGEKEDPPPSWLWQAHQLAAISLGPGSPAALAHYRKFLELGPEDSPYRRDAERALEAAGQPWTGN